MALRVSRVCLRGVTEVRSIADGQCYPISPTWTGLVPRVKGAYDHWRFVKRQLPLRATSLPITLPPVLYKSADQIALLEHALAVQRAEYQVTTLLTQLARELQTAEYFLQKHLLQQTERPSLHALWFSEEGLHTQPHVLAGLAAHHLVPLYSLLSHDVERGAMTRAEAVEVYEALMDCSTAQPAVVQRELTNQMIRVHCLTGAFDEALAVVDEMAARRVRRTFCTYAPLFRLLRARGDAAGHVRLLQHMYRVEGGRVAKVLFIDVPRLCYACGVCIRYNWPLITFCTTTTVSLLVIIYVLPNV